MPTFIQAPTGFHNSIWWKAFASHLLDKSANDHLRQLEQAFEARCRCVLAERLS
jgi:hypothetical protein